MPWRKACWICWYSKTIARGSQKSYYEDLYIQLNFGKSRKIRECWYWRKTNLKEKKSVTQPFSWPIFFLPNLCIAWIFNLPNLISNRYSTIYFELLYLYVHIMLPSLQVPVLLHIKMEIFFWYCKCIYELCRYEQGDKGFYFQYPLWELYECSLAWHIFMFTYV